MAEVIFWSCAGLIVYAYFGYHLLLKLVVWLLPAPVERRAAGRTDELPDMTVVVAVYNEARVIGRRIENLLALDYPAARLQIIVASDGSSDETVRVVRRYADAGVVVLDLPRQGKALAQNDAVDAARGEIVVFTDADSEFDRGFVRAVADHFAADRRVGCVVGNLVWRPVDTATGQLKDRYWSLETDLRRLESRLGILAGGTGAGMAVKKALWRPMSGPLDDSDSVTPLDVILQGSRLTLADDAIVYDEAFPSALSEFRAKVRGVSKSVIMITKRWRLEGWIKHPVISWRLMSHHFLRWFAPYLMLGALVSSFSLATVNAEYAAICLAEAAIAMLVLIGYVGERQQKKVFAASALFSFMALNAGMGLGLLKALVGVARGPWETE